MQYRSIIRGVPRQQQRGDDEYWSLVHALMEAGWYRLGQDRDPSGATWGFRSGHVVPAPAPARGGCRKPEQRAAERWIAAGSELAAMRRLLRELPPVADQNSTTSSGADSEVDTPDAAQPRAGPARASDSSNPSGPPSPERA